MPKFNGVVLGVALMAACTPATRPTEAAATAREDPLPSWGEGPARQDILAFVQRVTAQGTPGYVPPVDRIAVFDNDGTLWVEQPIYVEAVFTFDRVKELAPQHREWRTQAPFAGILEGHPEEALASGTKGALELFLATHSGVTPDEFREDVRDWLAEAHHPRFDRPYTDLVYQPMLELLAFLRANEFSTWIVSGGEVEFMRAWAPAGYGIPPEQIIGTAVTTSFQVRDGEPVLIREAELLYLDDGPGKPQAIDRIVGRRPILAFGNSDGDLEMLQWTAAGEGERFAGLVHHTDAEREWAYDRDSKIGTLDRALDAAQSANWTVVDTQDDWERMFE